MSDEVAKAHQEVATRNARAAVDDVARLRTEMVDHFNAQSKVLQAMHAQVQDLAQKYNLLLTQSFHGGSTSGE
jgi:uncharacterized membrane-anchored protein YhcB (DUF1043 family)